MPCARSNCSLKKCFQRAGSAVQVAWKSTPERVIAPFATVDLHARCTLVESGCLGMQPKVGGKLLLKLNMDTRPIANKYREGKMKSTLKRKLRVRVRLECHFQQKLV